MNSGFVAFRKFVRLLGLPTADRMDRRPAKTVRVSGAVSTVSSGGLTVRAEEKRMGDNLDRIDEVLATGLLKPTLAGKLRGKLGFLASLAFGKVGRSTLAPMARRKYAAGTRVLTHELRACLAW